ADRSRRVAIRRPGKPESGRLGRENEGGGAVGFRRRPHSQESTRAGDRKPHLRGKTDARARAAAADRAGAGVPGRGDDVAVGRRLRSWSGDFKIIMQAAAADPSDDFPYILLLKALAVCRAREAEFVNAAVKSLVSHGWAQACARGMGRPGSD